MTQLATDDRFPSTKWTLIHRLRSGDEAVSRLALDELCTQYHYPLYCYIRRHGLSHHDSQDALHDFLGKLIRLDTLAKADSAKGRLRAFLSTSLQNFLLNWRRDRSDLQREISSDATWPGSDPEERYRHEHFREDENPEHIFDRKWGHELLQRVLLLLGTHYAEKNRTPLFDALRPVLLAGGSLRGEDTSRIAASLGMKEGALRVALSRLLHDYRTILENEVFQTVSSKAEVDTEILQLLQIFRAR